MSDIAVTFRELIRLTKVGGAHSAWLNATAAEVAELLLEVENLRRVQDPRKLKTLLLARKVADADAVLRATGLADRRIQVLANRFSKSPCRIHDLLRLAGEPPATIVFDSGDEHEPT